MKRLLKKAKKLGINISKITKKVLGGFTFAPKDVEESQLRAKYKELFDAMVPILQKYNTSVEVASIDLTQPEDQAKGNYNRTSIDLCPGGELWSDVFEEEFSVENIPLYAFYEPQLILSKFIDAISRGSERMKEQLRELEMTKRIIGAIAGTVGENP